MSVGFEASEVLVRPLIGAKMVLLGKSNQSDEPSAEEGEVLAEAKTLAAEGAPEGLRQIAKGLRESYSADLSEQLAELLYSAGQPGIDLLVKLLGNPRAQPYAIGVLRRSDDPAVWEALVRLKLKWAEKARAQWSVKTKLRNSFVRRWRRSLPRDPDVRDGRYVIYRDRMAGYSVRLPEQFIVVEQELTRYEWRVVFSERRYLGGLTGARDAPIVSVQVGRPAAGSPTFEEYVPMQLLEDVFSKLPTRVKPEILQPFQPTLVNGHPAFKAVILAGTNFGYVYCLQTPLRRFELTATAELPQREIWGPVFEDIAQSLTWPGFST